MTSPRQRKKRLLALKKLKEQAEQTVTAAVETVVEVVETVSEVVAHVVEEVKEAVQPEPVKEQRDITLQEKVAARRAARLAKQKEKVETEQ